MIALRRHPRLSDGLLAGLAGLVLGAAAVGYQLHSTTIFKLALGALVIALVCVIVGSPRRVMLAVVLLDIPLQWGKHLGWNASVAKVGGLSGYDISATTIALVVLYVLWAVDSRPRDGRAPRLLLRPALPLIVYLAVNVVSVLAAGDKVLSAYALALLGQTLLLFIYVVGNVRTRSDVRFLVAVLLAGLVVESLLIIWVDKLGPSISLFGIRMIHVDPSGGRVGGTVGSPNDAAAYLTLLLPLALSVLASPVGARTRRLAIAGAGLGIVALMITGSRGGWVSFAISTAIIAVWGVRRGVLAGRTVLVVALAIGALIFPFWGTINQRWFGNDQGSAQSRVSMTVLAEHMIRAHPLLGLGVNNVGADIPQYAGPQFDGQWLYTIHDKYLLVWAEAGIAALVAFIWFLLATLRRGWSCARLGDPLLAPLAVGLTAGITGQLVHMGVDVFQSRPEVQGLWFTAAFVTAMWLISRRDPHLRLDWSG